MKDFFVYVFFSFFAFSSLLFLVYQDKQEINKDKEDTKIRMQKIFDDKESLQIEKEELISSLVKLKESLLDMKLETQRLKRELETERKSLASSYVKAREEKDLFLSFKLRVKDFQNRYKQWLLDYQKSNPPYWPPLPLCDEK